MAEMLFPSAFVETAASCSGPRYVRSQPSRETGGVLLNECEAKYVPQFELPYRNVSRYIGEVQQSWDRINPKDKMDIVNNLVENLPQLKDFLFKDQVKDSVTPETQSPTVPQTPSVPSVLSFIRDYIAISPKANTTELLNSLYYPDTPIKQVLSKDKQTEIKVSVDTWVESEYHTIKIVGTLLLVIIALVVIIAIKA